LLTILVYKPRRKIMKVCFPVETNKGSESSVFGHFGSAPGFVLYDTDSSEFDFIDNKDVSHEHGACNPAAAVAGREVDAVVVGGIGQGALMKLNAGGIRVYRSKSGQVGRDISLLREDGLELLGADMKTCSHSGHSCSH